MKFIIQPFLFYLVHIIDDTSFQVKHIFKSLVQHIRTCLFTTDAACTIHDDVFIFISLHHVHGHRKLFPKCITGYFNGILKMPHFIFIMIPHINHHRIRIVGELVKLFRINITSFIGHIKVGIFNAIGHNFLTHFNIQHIKTFAIIIHGNI